MLFHVTASHSPESCPIYNPEYQDAAREGSAKLAEWAKEGGVTIRFAVTAAPDHFIYYLLEADQHESVAQLLIRITPFPSEFTITPVLELAHAMETVLEEQA